MKKNMGGFDRAIRLMVALVIAVLYFTKTINGTVAVVLGVVAIIFALTSLVCVCPLYIPFGISTCKQKK